MQKSRLREFTVTRDKNLSQTYSQISQSSHCNRSVYQDKSFNQSSSSAFIKKNQTPICNNCVNKRLIDEKQEKERREKELEFEEARKKNDLLKSKVDQNKKMRQQLLKEAEVYNRKVMTSQLNSVRSAKEFDSVYMREVHLREKEVEELEEEVKKLRKQNEERYRGELKQQYEEDAIKKQKEREEKLKTESNKPLISSRSSRQIGIKYVEELKKQIAQEKRHKEQEKQLQRDLQKKVQTCAMDKFLEFTEFKTSRRSQINPQIFEEMKQLEFQRKQSKIEQRLAEEQERKEKLLNNKKQIEKEAQKSFEQANAYASLLEKQARSKKYLKEYQKSIDTRQEIPLKFTEDVLADSRKSKPCGDCHENVDERALSLY